MVNFIALRDASSLKFVYIGQIYSWIYSQSIITFHGVEKILRVVQTTIRSKIRPGVCRCIPIQNYIGALWNYFSVYLIYIPKYLSLQAFRRSAVPWIIQNLWTETWENIMGAIIFDRYAPGVQNRRLRYDPLFLLLPPQSYIEVKVEHYG